MNKKEVSGAQVEYTKGGQIRKEVKDVMGGVLDHVEFKTL